MQWLTCVTGSSGIIYALCLGGTLTPVSNYVLIFELFIEFCACHSAVNAGDRFFFQLLCIYEPTRKL